MNLINCPNCQNQINRNNNMCPYCGNTINQNISNINHQTKGIQKKKITNSLKIGIYIIVLIKNHIKQEVNYEIQILLRQETQTESQGRG